MAICLAALAGFVDASGYIHFDHLFVSVMSGNSTQAMVAAAGRRGAEFVMLARTIALFVAGVTSGELLRAAAGRWGRALVLVAVTVLIVAAWILLRTGAGGAWVSSPLTLAMGIQNAAVHTAEGISVALTYVTGTLVHVGRGIAKALRGEGPWHGPLPFLGLWTGFISGGLGGALAAERSLAVALEIAGGVAGALLVWALVAALIASEAERG